MYINLNDLPADAAGEYLRSKFFPDWYRNGSWELIKSEDLEWSSNEKRMSSYAGEDTVTLFEAALMFEGSTVYARWYWDEDWYLEFSGRFRTLANDDAKKDCGWVRL